jgi:hypothetical protein
MEKRGGGYGNWIEKEWNIVEIVLLRHFETVSQMNDFGLSRSDPALLSSKFGCKFQS